KQSPSREHCRMRERLSSLQMGNGLVFTRGRTENSKGLRSLAALLLRSLTLQILLTVLFGTRMVLSTSGSQNGLRVFQQTAASWIRSLRSRTAKLHIVHNSCHAVMLYCSRSQMQQVLPIVGIRAKSLCKR